MRPLFLTLFLLSSCTQLQGPYIKPEATVGDRWKEEHLQETTENPSLESWWSLFNDTLLKDYEWRSIENNQTIAIAYHRMGQAYYLSRSDLGALFPSVSLNPRFFKQGSRFVFGGSPVPTPIAPERSIISIYELPLSFNWQVDLWGRLTQSYLNAFYQFQSQFFRYQGALNQITSDVAVNYYLLRGYDSEIEVLNHTIRSRIDNFDINKTRYEAGLIDYLDVTRAEVDLAAAEAELENVQRRRLLQEHVLAVLQNQVPSLFDVPYAPLPLEAEPPKIPASIPCEILLKRPDILAAERNVAAFHANIGVAYAQFFPSLGLSGKLGYASSTLENLFDWKSRLWQEAVDIVQILFDGGQLLANLNFSKEAYLEAVSLYIETVLNALKEVEDALSNLRQREAQQKALMRTYLAAKETYQLAKNRYESGLIDYLDVVVAERDLLNSARAVTIVHAQRFIDTALLIKALGGGWIESAEDN